MIDDHSSSSLVVPASTQDRSQGVLSAAVVLVTGGTSGIGRETAIAYAQQQAKMVVVVCRIDEGEETVKNAKTEHRFPATHNRSIPYDPA